MGKLPLLTPREVEANLKALGFVLRNQVGSHRQWVKAASKNRIKAVVTVDQSHRQFSKEMMKRMIRQSLHSQEEFCSGVANEPVIGEPATDGGK